ncbi:MAG: glycosyltransferase family 39 protein [Mycobacteriaceae bacterium]|nr:glycosyltransferase family 39 protein [Mycobacteriaceae bacterium]
MAAVVTEAQHGAESAAAAREPRRWVTRLALAVLLAGTAVLYSYNLGANGWANAFYSAAVQAGAQSWKAFLFGSSDAVNSITVDKPPMSLWPMELSVRLFGLNPWSILVPQALMGVAAVALLWDAVRRRFGETAGLVAGLVLALTPVAVAIFRYNNPDALLVLLMIGAAWALLRAVDDGRTRWLVLSGVLVGLGYLTKQLQVALVLPAFAIVYLFAAPPKLVKRLWQLVVGLAAAVVTAGWWVATVQLWPAADRPWIGGSQRNSILELTFAYNGFGRLTGQEPGSIGGFARLGREAVGGRGDALMRTWGQPGIGRMFQPLQVGQISWLLGAALIFLVALLGWRGRAPRTDAQRASVLLWGLWLIGTAAVFSFMAGIFHPYYTIALAPAIAALIGIGVVAMWRLRDTLWAQATLAAAAAATVATTFFVLRYTSSYYPWLRWIGVVGVAVIIVWLLGIGADWAERRVAMIAVVVAAVGLGLSGPFAYALTTIHRGTSGALPAGGPPVVSARHRPPSWEASGRSQGCDLMEAGRPEQAVVEMLKDRADSYTWVAATIGSVCASGYQLAAGNPVMPVGGFNGSDPSPPVGEFELLVISGRIHYFIVDPTNDDTDSHDQSVHLNNSGKIQLWVKRNFAPIPMRDVTLYDLTR